MKKIITLTTLSLFVFSSYGACPDGKTYPVTLTFDDGPHPVLTPKVLDVLKAEKVKGTFFVLGNRFAGGKANPATKVSYDILDRTKKEGHIIGSHTYDHLAHSKQTPEVMRKNITRATPLLKDYLSPVLRLPYGDGSFRSNNPETQRKNDLVMATVKSAGFKHVGWDIDTNDWDAKKRPTLLPTMLRQICSQKGGIILFHDIQKFTVDHLQSWIKAIKQEGHTFVGLEHFVPGADGKISPEFCGPDSGVKPINDLDKSVNDVLKNITN